MSYSVKAIDELDSIHHGAVKLAGAELAVGAFGLQVLDLPAGFADYPEHDHAEDGQEEVYVLLRGDAGFVIDGDEVAVRAGDIVRVDAASRRKILPGPDGVRALAIGATPGSTYERPQDFRLRVQA